MKKAKVIFHVDMNSFYASVEMAYNPSLKGKAVAIAGNPEERKGIIVTSSYEARAKGVKTTMPLWEARKLCPSLIVLRPNFDRYREVSSNIFRLLASMTDMIEPVSIDEGYLDVTDIPIHPVQLANQIQQMLLQQLDIPCSIGIGPNKFLAKTASDMKKPLGITILRKRELSNKLWPLPVGGMYGIGEKTAAKLKKIDIHTIGDLANTDVYTLTQLLGINGERLRNRANGIDTRDVDPNSVNEFKSIGNSRTLPEDTSDMDALRQMLFQLAVRVDERLTRREMTGKTVQLMIRYGDRQTITRSKKLHSYVGGLEDIVPVVYDLLDMHWNLDPIRLLGVTVSDLLDKKDVLEQLNLFTFEKAVKKAKLEEMVQELKSKYGTDAFPAMYEDEAVGKEGDKLLGTSFQKDFLDDFKS